MKKILLIIALLFMMQTCTYAREFKIKLSDATTEKIISFVSEDIVIQANNKIIEYTEETGAPFIDVNGRSLVPLRKTFESLDVTISWDPELNAAILYRENDKIQVPIGNEEILLNGYPIKMDTRAQIVNGRTYVPVRPIIEALGGVVEWDPDLMSTNLYFEKVDDTYYESDKISEEMNAQVISDVIYQRVDEMLAMNIQDGKSLDEFKNLVDGQWIKKEHVVQIEYNNNPNYKSSIMYLEQKYGKLKMNMSYTLLDGSKKESVNFTDNDMITARGTDVPSTVIRGEKVITEFSFTPQLNNKFEYKLISSTNHFEPFERELSGNMAFIDNDTLVQKIVLENPSTEIKKLSVVIIEERIK